MGGRWVSRYEMPSVPSDSYVPREDESKVECPVFKTWSTPFGSGLRRQWQIRDRSLVTQSLKKGSPSPSGVLYLKISRWVSLTETNLCEPLQVRFPVRSFVTLKTTILLPTSVLPLFNLTSGRWNGLSRFFSLSIPLGKTSVPFEVSDRFLW